MNEAQLKTIRNKAIRSAQEVGAGAAIVQATLDVINEEIGEMTRVRDGLKALMKPPKRPYKARSNGAATTDTRPAYERAHAWLKTHPGSRSADIAEGTNIPLSGMSNHMIVLVEKGMVRRRKSKGRVMFWAK